MALIPLADASSGDRLDDYVEAQVHDAVVLAEDVEALVLDRCFEETAVEKGRGRCRAPSSGTPGSASTSRSWPAIPTSGASATWRSGCRWLATDASTRR